jgi:hypothetical protein
MFTCKKKQKQKTRYILVILEKPPSLIYALALTSYCIKDLNKTMLVFHKTMAIPSPLLEETIAYQETRNNS